MTTPERIDAIRTLAILVNTDTGKLAGGGFYNRFSEETSKFAEEKIVELIKEL